MPKIQPRASDAQMDALLNEDRPGGWRLSDKGNPTRGSPYGYTLTVFPRHGRWAWSMARDSRVRFSQRTYPSKQEAKDAVWQEATREQ